MIKLKLLPFLILFVICSVPTVSLSADRFSVVVDPPKGWSINESAPSRPDSFPEVWFAPPQGRDAGFLVMDIGRVNSSASLADQLLKRHVWWFTELRNSSLEQEG